MNDKIHSLLNSFLIQNKCSSIFKLNMYKKWWTFTLFEYINKYEENYLKINKNQPLKYYSIINYAFDWEQTYHGVEFWRKISDEWITLMYENENLIFQRKKPQFKSIW